MATLLNGGFCKVCKISCGNLKNMESHIKGKKHKRALPKNVTVSGLHPDLSVDTINEYFSKFGKISTFTYNKTSGTITYSFEDNETMTDVILRNHLLNGRPVALSWQSPLLSPQPSSNEVPTLIMTPENSTISIPQLDQIDICESLSTVQSFDEKIKLLRNKLRANQKQINETCNQIISDIHQAIRRHFPICKIYIFGSTITQLDYLGCDLDIYVDKAKSIKTTEVQCLTRMKSDLYQSKKFNELILIRTAKVPIIKCKHTETKTNCDINVKSMLPIYNSQLINYYLTIDDRLHQLMIFIKYLFHLHDFKKTGYFSSYSLAWLFIFYLQQPPYNLPNVKQLQIDNDNNQLENGWNCYFKQLKILDNNSKLSQSSLLEIFVGFLKFYTNFDYTTNVICPYLGKRLKRTDFFNHESLPDSFRLYKDNINNGQPPLHINSAIVIQDPFEHNRNLTAVTAANCLGRFVITCEVFLKDYLKHNDALLLLLTRPLTKTEESNVNFTFNYPQFNENKSEFIIKIRKILTDILKFDINELTVFPQYSEIIGEQYEKIIGFKCRGNINVWQDRIITLKNLQQNNRLKDNTLLEQDIEVTLQLIKNFAPTSNLSLTIHFIYNQQLSKIHCFVHSDNNCKFFNYAIVFLKNRIVAWLLNQETAEETVDIKEELSQVNNKVEEEMIETTWKVDQQFEDKKEDSEVLEKSENQEQIKNSTDELEEIGDSNIKDDLEVVDAINEPDAVEEEQVEEEDVPDDFFDDFSNADFMEGLDIVDAWDGNPVLPSNEESNDQDNQSCDRSKHSKDNQKHSHDMKRRSRTPKRRRLHSNSNEHRYRSKSPRDHDRYRLRRDPEKTRRDICKDKLKCARDKEMKLVSDKLQLVETGLVPPGTEMDLDLTEIDSLKRQQEQHSNQSINGSSEKHRSLSSKRHRSNSRDYARKRHSRSGDGSRKRRDNSHHSDLSEREMWLRETRRSRKRSRSESPATKLARKQDIAKKRSFLEEIREKLNEVSCPVPTIPQYIQQQQQQQVYPPQPVPAPVPPPQQHYYQNQQYDQSYFIGNSGNYNNGGITELPLNNTQQTIVSVPIVSVSPMTSVQYPVPAVTPTRSNLTPVATVETDQKIIETPTEKSEKDTSDVTKLFADKKISLSDFLTITAKSEVQSSTPEHLQKKIKVISRCQDVLKVLSDERKFHGRLRVKPTKEKKQTCEGKYQSPLRKIPVVRFHFTTRTSSPPSSTTKKTDNFASALDKVLQKIGIIRETVDLEQSSTIDLTTSSNEDTSVLAVKASQLINKKDNNFERQSCEECKKRKKLVFTDVGTQCIEAKETATIGIQVNEDELQPSKAHMKESIAFLTPAQLLKKTKDRDENLQKDDKRILLSSPSSASSSSPNKLKLLIPPSEFLKNFRQNPDNRSRDGNYRENYRYPGNVDFDHQQLPPLTAPSQYQGFYGARLPPPHGQSYDDYSRSRYGPSRY